MLDHSLQQQSPPRIRRSPQVRLQAAEIYALYSLITPTRRPTPRGNYAIWRKKNCGTSTSLAPRPAACSKARGRFSLSNTFGIGFCWGLLPLETLVYAEHPYYWAMRKVYRARHGRKSGLGNGRRAFSVRKGMPLTLQLLIGPLAATLFVGFFATSDLKSFLVLTSSVGVILWSLQLPLLATANQGGAPARGFGRNWERLPTDSHIDEAR